MPTTPQAQRWLRTFQPRPDAPVRLVCLPHAGGTAAFYRTWGSRMPPSIEVSAVQYPGRLDRFGEPVPERMADLVAGIAAVLTGLRAEAVVLFGHSMGAYTAYEVARVLERTEIVPLRHLVVSGLPDPDRHTPGDVHTGDDDAVVAELRRLGGTDAELLDDPEIRDLLLPAVRGDYRIIETYRHRPGPPLSCPITVFVGDADPEVTPEQAKGWGALTTGGCEVVVFPGDHFYLAGREAEVTEALAARIGPR
ncbi:pyochelin biosynthetic protein PchC [Thermocatellispora tengchongensis]|uniref:Pyochelin biosynthetic protein PchC n=1 Tax=Thermocatellispora tengchongensis TaxID=1073253 RepID=A0A840PE03_9ACTN|nr:alpha/beta fold hydrolase [Thermocatellispora tengchongensis]MBB5134275.1 pyochelin biosynthetic protein PchC [Thermocatellispora tengchongensis]